MTPDEHMESLLTTEADGGELRFMFFWGHRPRPDGLPGPGCLSQWWPAAFTVDGVRYLTAEHWMMAGKARLFGDADAEEQVLAAASPGAAKAIGRRVSGFDEQAWEAARFDLVVAGNLAKFSQHGELAAFLAATAPSVLVEASPLDRIWGIGLPAAHQDARRPSCWRGLNLLGFALMNVREQLQASHPQQAPAHA
jgi:ribA/ribD-fused uncharacterized protein